MKRYDLLNALIHRFGYESYLEIGVRSPRDCFDKVRCKHKDGVDPGPRGPCKFIMTSDQFFSDVQPKRKTAYDLVFIDGLHLDYQVLRDVENSLKWLRDSGTIVLHDCNPPTIKHQIEDWDGRSPWNGTVWKAFVELRRTRPDLWMATINDDWGMGVIRRGSQDVLLYNGELTWEWFVANRAGALNLMAESVFWNTLDGRPDAADAHR